MRKARFDRYLCVTCHDALIQKLKTGLVPLSYLQHVELYRHQNLQMKLQREQLTKNQIFIIYDFSTIHETSIFKLKNMSCYVAWVDQDNTLKHHYFDFFACAKHDHKFIDYSFKMLPFLIWDKFRISCCLKEVFIWSDGGTKSNNSLGTFFFLASQWRSIVHLNYFAPHHGHNIVDGHFGNGKRLIRRAFPPPFLIKTKEEIMQIWKTIPHTTVQYLEAISPNATTVKKISGIRKWFYIFFPFSESHEKEKKIYAFGKTGDNTTLMATPTLKIK